MKSIVMWGLAHFNWMWVPLAKRLREGTGADIHFICSSPMSVEYWKALDKDGTISSFTTYSHFFTEYDRCDRPPSEIYERARRYEDKYNTLVSDVLQADRHLGRGFYAGGINHQSSELSRKVDYLKSVNLFNKVFKFWEEFFDRVSPDLAITFSSGIVGKPCSVVARKRGIPVRFPGLARYQSYFHWVEDEYFTYSAIEKRYRSIAPEEVAELAAQHEINGLKRLPWADDFYCTYAKIKTVKTFLGRMAELIRKDIFRRYHRVDNMRHYDVLDGIKYVWRCRRWLKAMDHAKYPGADELAGRSFVLFPLQVEPESSLNMLSPEFNEQLGLIEMVAKNLPAGTTLVVKEHLVASASRPRDFYRTLLDMPNVVMISPYEYAADIARLARCVAVITSSLGQEAAIMGIPVLSFGLHNNYNFLPHVHVIRSWKELRPLLSDLISKDTAEARRRRQRDGMRYLAALKASSWDGVDFAAKYKRSVTEKEVEILYLSLMESLEAGDGNRQKIR